MCGLQALHKVKWQLRQIFPLRSRTTAVARQRGSEVYQRLTCAWPLWAILRSLAADCSFHDNNMLLSFLLPNQCCCLIHFTVWSFTNTCSKANTPSVQLCVHVRSLFEILDAGWDGGGSHSLLGCRNSQEFVAAYYWTSNSLIKLRKKVDLDNCSGKSGGKRWQLQHFANLVALSLVLISPGVIWHPHYGQPNIPGVFQLFCSLQALKCKRSVEEKCISWSVVSSHSEPIPYVI